MPSSSMEQQLRALRQLVHVTPSSSSSSSSCTPVAMAATALESVARVYGEHAETLARSAALANQVEHELEASVALLDACAAARDALCAMRARAVAAESAARRRGKNGAAAAAHRAYERLARRACADARRHRRRSISSSEADDGAHAMREVRRLTVAVLERVVAALSRRVPGVGRSRSVSGGGWSTCVARAFRLKSGARVVACEDVDDGDAGDVLACKKDAHDGEAAERAQRRQREFRELVDVIGEMEDGVEVLFRRLVQCRVCLLNTRSCF